MEQNKQGKQIKPPRAHSTKDVYKYYKQKYPTAKEPYWLFKEVVARFNKKVANAVIYGQVFNFGSRLGHLLIKKIRRNYDKPVVDWGESKRVKAELIELGKIPRNAENPTGEDWLIYYSDPWYLRWGWAKKRLCKVKNQSVYKFKPTGNRSKKAGNNSLAVLGNKGKLTLMNKINPALHLSYTGHMYKQEE